MATPMGKLPTELLVEIFAHSVNEPPAQPIRIDEADAPRNPTRQALLLSQVCPYWRRIVNSTPKLWTAGVVDVRLDRKSCRTEAYIDGLKTLLERSAPLSISVSLTQKGDVVTSAGAMSQAATTSTVIRAMAPTIRRWKSLEVDCLSFKPLTALPGGAFPALESLSIQYDTYGQTDPVRAFLPAPRLQHLTLSLFGPAARAQGQLLLMPWSQLTHLKLDDHSLVRCREILIQCTNLISAELITTEWNYNHTVSAPDTVLPFLETLRVRFDMGDDEIGHVEPFFEPLSLPSLRTLALVFDPTPGVLWPTDDFSAFQSRSPHIADIALTNCPITPMELVTLLRRAPAIKTLTVKDSAGCIDEDVLRLLTYDETDTSPLAPQLRQIHWEAIGYIFSERMLEAAIRSRWWTDAQEASGATPSRVVRLQKVTILRYERDAMGDGLVHRMQDVVEQGLGLNLAW